ncbi:MAG: hypothetical protein IK038_06340 [Bacteroidaceae bacterium]|nr:hypothetical protein [Bacteroidaceae bacterium]
MKKVLLFLDQMDSLALEEAVIQLKEGNFIYFVQCDKAVGICRFNKGGLSPYCALCKHALKPKITELKKEYSNINYVTVTDLVDKDIIEKSKSVSFEYNNVSELKSLNYKGVEVGYAAFSTFVSQTRDIDPVFNDSFYGFINALLKSQVLLVEALEPYIDRIKPDLVVFHNGRFSSLKPIYQLAKNKGIDYISTEHMRDENKVSRKNNTLNNIPHSEAVLVEKIERYWNEGKEDKYEIGKGFFENRRYGKFAGDKIYTLRQSAGKMPEGFEKDKINIAIYNSSEDEYFSISKEYDDAVLFPTQREAFETIFEHYKDNKDMHFYLRLHPNLMDTPDKYKDQFLHFNYDNVTVITPDSTISSYTLMDNCDKIIVFNSTMGLESTYWDKPVIILSTTYYTEMGIAYRPYTPKEMFDLIDNRELPVKGKDKCIKAGYLMTGIPYPKLEYYPDTEIVKSLSKRIYVVVRNQYKFLGSSFLLGFIMKVMTMMMHYIGKSKNLQ